MKDNLKLANNVLMRIVAAFTASALGVIGAGAVAGISTIKAMSVAGITAVAAVVEKLARGFMDDGKLTLDEINAAFSAIDTNAKTAADLQVEARQSGTAITVNTDGTITPAAQGASADAPAAPETPANAPAAPETPADASIPEAAKDPNYN
jgi:hypothetical protein